MVRSVDGGMDENLTRNLIEAARNIRECTGGFWTDQLNNMDQLSCYRTMGDEIWRQTEGRIDAFVQSVGTAACVRGTAEALRQHSSNIHIVAVEPMNLQFCPGDKPVSTRLKAWARGSSCRFGILA